MAAIVSDYWGWDLTATHATINVVNSNWTATNAAPYLIRVEAPAIPKFMFDGKVFADAQTMKLYKNELHSRQCWVVPERIDPVYSQVKIHWMKRAVPNQKQQRHNKRRRYLERIRKM